MVLQRKYLYHLQATLTTEQQPDCCSCWLPSSSESAPRLAPAGMKQAAQQSEQADIKGSAPPCGCTEDCPCTAGCPNMQNSSMTRTPLATLASAQGQANDMDCPSTTSAVPMAAAASEEQTPASNFKRKFSRQRQQQGTGQKRKADMAWLQGGDDTPCTDNSSRKNSFRGALWGAMTGPGVASTDDGEPVLSQTPGADRLLLPNGIVTWSARSHTCLCMLKSCIADSVPITHVSCI